MIKYLLLVSMIILGGVPTMANSAEQFTLFVTRHAEKQPVASDPELSELGLLRSSQLAQTLKNVQLKAIYATKFKRTQQTAEPAAKHFELAIASYPAGDSEALAEEVLAKRQNALIVGHSNTVPDIVKALGGEAKALTEQDYGDLFMLQFIEGQVITTPLFIPVHDF